MGRPHQIPCLFSREINRADPGRSRKSSIPSNGYYGDKTKRDAPGVQQSVCCTEHPMVSGCQGCDCDDQYYMHQAWSLQEPFLQFYFHYYSILYLPLTSSLFSKLVKITKTICPIPGGWGMKEGRCEHTRNNSAVGILSVLQQRVPHG